MKKLILYGVRQWELRRDIEHFLDDGYEVIGCSDTYYTSDILDGKNFIPPEQLPNAEFDYIMLLSRRENVQEEMRSSLLDLGIPPEKIIRPLMFLYQNRLKVVDLIGDIEAGYQGEEGLIFGPSGAYFGILEKKLRPAFYSCTWPGMDIYYYYRIFQHMRQRGLLSRVKTALLTIHHHWFNYDMSRALYEYRWGQVLALQGLDDWHNYQKTPEGPEYVTNYRMFGRKTLEYYHFNKDFLKLLNQNRIIYQGEDGEENMYGPWSRAYPETLAENTAVFADFCREMAEEGITPVVIVPPWYVKGLNQATLEYGKKRKQEFYQIMDTVGSGINVFDFYDVYADRREFFMDIVHLNSDGAEAFTELLNQTVLREMKEKNV